MKHREPISAERYTYTVVFEQAEDGGYVVTCPALPGLVSEGETLDEARAMAKDAIEGHLEALRELGQPIPVGEEHLAPVIREEITVTVPKA